VRRTAPTYAISLLVLAGAVLLRWLLDPLMGNSLPLVTLFGAVAGAVWVGGYRPALLVALAGYVACHYLFIEPRGAFAFDAGFVRSRTSILSSCLPISRRNASAGMARSIAATPRNGTSPRAIMRAAAAVG